MRDGRPAANTMAALEGERAKLDERVSALTETLDEYRDVVEEDSAQARAIREIERNVKEDARSLLEEDRLLRLGIVGQIKAGKSTLLNLLLFDGHDVLPKAATPMTAALTHIVKHDKNEIEVSYYSRKEWDQIEEYARAFRKTRASQQEGAENEPAEWRASRELVEMAAERGLQVEQYLDTTETAPVSMENLNRELRRLVGVEGKTTPLVKSVTIRCSQGIPDLDIVDTPGLNDPIVSRSLETAKLLRKCDAVLLLSYAGQFLDSVDMDFLQERIPEEGIRKRLLVGSKFDSALIDVSKDYRGDLQEAQAGTPAQLTKQAMSAIRQRRDPDDTPTVKEEDILFVSVVCASLAGKPVPQWSEDERAAFEALRKHYPDWFDPPEEDTLDEHTGNTLIAIGNRRSIEECLAAIRRDKDRILREKVQRFLEEKRRAVIEELDDLIADVTTRHEDLRTSDLGKIRDQKQMVEDVIEGVEESLVAKWADLIEEERRNTVGDLRDSIKQITKEATRDINQAYKQRRSAGMWDKFMNIFTDNLDDNLLAEVNEFLQNTFEDIAQKVQRIKKDAFDHNFVSEAVRKLSRTVASELRGQTASEINPGRIKPVLRRTISEILGGARNAIENYQILIRVLEYSKIPRMEPLN